LSQADVVHQNIVFGLRSEIEAKAVLLAEAMEELAAARSSSRRRLFFLLCSLFRCLLDPSQIIQLSCTPLFVTAVIS